MSKNGVISQYVPTKEQLKKDRRSSPWLAWLRLFRFSGKVKVGDD
jgi:hypothetical protein